MARRKGGVLEKLIRSWIKLIGNRTQLTFKSKTKYGFNSQFETHLKTIGLGKISGNYIEKLAYHEVESWAEGTKEDEMIFLPYLEIIK